MRDGRRRGRRRGCFEKQTGRVDEPAYAPPQYRELDAEAEAAENGDGNAQTAS